MVLRKPTPQENLIPRPLSQAVNNPPYPTTPSDEQPPVLPPSSDHNHVYSPNLNESPAFNLKPLDDAKKQQEDDNDDDDESDYSEDWDKSDDEEHELPDPLKVGGGKPLPPSSNAPTIPDALRAGPPPGVASKHSAENISPEPTGASAGSYGGISNSSAGSVPLQTNNPYLKMQNTGNSNFGGESSHQIWGDTPSHAQTYSDLVELPSFQTPDTPTNKMANMSLPGCDQTQQNARPSDQPPVIAVESATPSSASQLTSPRYESNASEAWNSGIGRPSVENQNVTDQHNVPAYSQQHGRQQSWEHNSGEQEQRETSTAQEALEREPLQKEVQSASTAAKFDPPASSPPSEEPVPALPPRPTEEQPPAMPPRPLETGVIGSSATGPESPAAVINRQQKEIYQIKKIRWHDVTQRSIRESPILTQNLNGPCPLLALVNALVLSTPSGTETALVEALRTRETVSLGLLLDVVFDELMCGRRGGAAQELPDVTELYQFLLGLHTGLNVNPMFVQDADATDGPSTLEPSSNVKAGGFENTRDMRLYRTFNIPLMHGWLPEAGSDAYYAFERIAKSYETSQYVQFQEEELDAKLQSGDALTPDEQQMFTDIHAIKEFLNRWPTQLTNYGLRTMRDNIQPGQVAILFRNDHFSTLYKDPKVGQLVTLVTDQGYSSHEEIVWESLVDVNGLGSNLFSGDFRPVGEQSVAPQPQTERSIRSLLDVDDNEGWTTVQSQRGNRRQQSSANQNEVSTSSNADPSNTEQEDHDLALALQLQEEEDDRHRRSVEDRRRRDNQQSSPGNRRPTRSGENPPLIPPRRNNVQANSRTSNEPAPPPTYEEAAVNPPYHPPQGHPQNPSAPMHPQGSVSGVNGPVSSPPPRRASRPMGGVPQGMPGRPGRRQSAGMVGPNGEERERCALM